MRATTFYYTLFALGWCSPTPKNYIVCVHTDNLEFHLGQVSYSVNNKFTIGDLSGYKVSADSDLYERISGLSEVLNIEEDTMAYPDSWGLDRVNQRDLPLDGDTTYSGNGAGVNVYVIDTGINVGIVDFGGRASWGANFVGDGIDNDCNGHGTHVAGTIGSNTYGIATNVNLVAVKVFGCSGGSPFSAIIAAVEWSTTNCLASGKRCIINMSLGGGVSVALNAAVAASVSAGVHNIVAAGNENSDSCTKSPASAPNAITVASITDSDTRSVFSNWGICVDIFAPGSGITSWNHLGSPWTISGTSMAAPHVAGVAARFLGETDLTPAEMATKLSTLASIGKVSDPRGSVNLLLYIPADDSTPGDLDAPDANTLVFYHEVTGKELETAVSSGFTTFVPTAVEWAAMTTSNFATYRGIVFGDPHCHGDEDFKLKGAYANRDIWTPAVSGNVLIHSFDPSWHDAYGSEPGSIAFLNSTVNYVGKEADKTGFYMSTSCYNFDGYVVDILDGFGTFIVSPSHHGDDIHILDTEHSSLMGSTDDSLSFWGSSVHNFFTSFPDDFKAIAIAEDPTGDDYDGKIGYAVLLVKRVELPFTCEGKSNGYQQCANTEEYYECVWGSLYTRPVSPYTDCCDWSAAERIMMVSDGMTCPF
jgi:subtilisin family serine protease